MNFKVLLVFNLLISFSLSPIINDKDGTITSCNWKALLLWLFSATKTNTKYEILITNYAGHRPALCVSGEEVRMASCASARTHWPVWRMRIKSIIIIIFFIIVHHLSVETSSELIFFTDITDYIRGEKSVMWRNFRFL